MANNKYSDHTAAQINFGGYLPGVYHSDVNNTLSDMVFDRYFSKDDTVQVTGFIGTGNPTALINRQIQEVSYDTQDLAHRQAYQLAPTVYTKVGTVETAMSFQNFLTQLELQGVDINRLHNWGATTAFNWVPPINIDMLVNYEDYFWTSENLADTPQYLTIENVCKKATDKLTAHKSLMQQRGIQLTVISVDFISNVFVVPGKWDNMFVEDYVFETTLSNSRNFNGNTWKIAAVVYDSTGDKTRVTVQERIAPIIQPTEPKIGAWWFDPTTDTLMDWNGIGWIEHTDSIMSQIIIPSLFVVNGTSFDNNSFVINGKQDDIFAPGFVFVTKDSNNINIEQKYWTTSSVEFDINTNKTTLYTVEPLALNSDIAPSTPQFIGQWWYSPSTKTLSSWNGNTWSTVPKNITTNISLAELMVIYQAEVNCKCDHARGWDIGQWDDNSVGNVAWNTTLLDTITFASEYDWMVYNTSHPETGMVADGIIQPLSLWYDTTTNNLYQYGDKVHPTPSDVDYYPVWNVVAGNFSAVLQLTIAQENWDYSNDCEVQTPTQWSAQNNWQHKTAIDTFASVKRAQVPILEFDSHLELNQWTKYTYQWKYRTDRSQQFENTPSAPSRLELEPIKYYQALAYQDSWFIYLFDNQFSDMVNMNLTNIFVPGYKFRIVDDMGTTSVFTVELSEFKSMANSTNPRLVSDSWATVVRLEEKLFDAPLVGGGVAHCRIIPNKTSTGDIWTGYHTHWCLDTNATVTSAAPPQPLDLWRADSFAEYQQVVNNPNLVDFVPQVTSISIGKNFQEFVVDIDGVFTIDLVSTLLYTPATVQPYALAGSKSLRVYINGIRQYGTYDEIVSLVTAGYTMVGDTVNNDTMVEHVTGITFNPSTVLKMGDVVRMEVGPASYYDMGMFSVPVRTVEDNDEFADFVLAGIQPVYQDMSSFGLTEQTKIDTNQYPQFNIYNILSGDVAITSPIITFKESPTMPVHNALLRRIVTSGDDYEFDQHLLDSENTQLYGYRSDKSTVINKWWFCPTTSVLLFMDNNAWCSAVIVTTSDGNNAARLPIVSTTEPTISGLEKSIWYNPLTNILYTLTVSNTWDIHPTTVIVNDIDPSLRTIWRHGTNNEQYIPTYVDINRTEVPIGSIDGSWGIIDQWFFNPDHKNNKSVKFSQLLPHFRSIIENQTKSVGLISGGVYTKQQSEYNYGIGGTIKEMNGAFDTLVSATNVTNVTPVGVIEYAAAEYSSNIRFIRDLFNRSIVDLFGTYVVDGTGSFSYYVTNNIIADYEKNDYTTSIYADTSAYDEMTKEGVKNWIATAPMFGLAPVNKPYLLNDGQFVQIVHHDGHRTNINYTLSEEDTIARKIISLADPRLDNQKLGALGPSSPPATEQDFVLKFGGSVRTGVCWYETSQLRKFYRCEVYAVGAIHPSFYKDGIELADEILYYNVITHCVFRKVGLEWVADTVPGSYDITPLWKLVSLEKLLGELYLELETRLYARCNQVSPAYDYSELTPTTSEELVYATNLKKRFDEYSINYSVPNPLINTQYRQTDAFTWNYLTSVIDTPPHLQIAPKPVVCWQALYTNWFGTPYPHLEPWKLQGFVDKPEWWDVEYLEQPYTADWQPNHIYYVNDSFVYLEVGYKVISDYLSGIEFGEVDATNTTDIPRKWKFAYIPTESSIGVGMWENIGSGQVPIGRLYPSGIISTGNAYNDGQQLPTYSYFAVNISNSSVAGGYLPDQLLPPYYSTEDEHSRSLYTSMVEINAPDADYVFGDGSPIEWQWTVSPQYVYDKPIIAYLMQPVKFLRAAFGPKYSWADMLEVDTTFGQVYSHNGAMFHGDMYNTNQLYQATGLNQWYVNFNRFAGFDTNDEFRRQWVDWKPLMSYRFNGIVDVGTLDVASKHFDLISEDYNVILSNNGIFKETWVDAFNVSVVNIPPSIIQYNNQGKWKMEVSSLADIARDIYYYDVKAYPFVVDRITDECFAYRYTITLVDQPGRRVYVMGNETGIFVPNSNISITRSTSLDGNYTVVSSVYEASVDRTRINLAEELPSSLADGVVFVNSFVIPWSTGDMVVLSSEKGLPAPLAQNTPYFVVNTNNQSFKLAETFNDALMGITIDIKTSGAGIHTVAEIVSSFLVFGGDGHSKETWFHYVLDKDRVLTMASPQVINGMQSLVNLIDGYAEYQRDQGIILDSADSMDFDPNSGRLITWSLETERFIDWAYGLRRAKMSVSDRFEFTANLTDNTITAVDAIPNWGSGTAIQLSTTGSLPAPLIAPDVYYVVQTTTPGVFKLSASQDTSYLAFHIDLLTQGSGHFYAATKSNLVNYPTFEINPSRNNIWLSSPQGVLSNVVSGPYTDIRVRQTIFDQYGRPLRADKLIINRQDKRNKISIIPQVTNDVDLFYVNDPYNYIHLGGGHFFVEGYEHVLLFNPYTVGNSLVYDSFLGLYTKKFEMDFYKKAEYNLRPNIGGYFLDGNKFTRNIEGAATDLNNYYDVYIGSENTHTKQLSRELLGYHGTTDYMNLLNVNSKSQFIFYRGMLHAKGSDNSVLAYINSRHFVEAGIDDYWAVKIADFGDSRPCVYPEILIHAEDEVIDDIRLEFVGLSDDINSVDLLDAITNKGFKQVSFGDDSRWNNFPEQRAEIIQPLFLDAEVSTITRVLVAPVPPSIPKSQDFEYWFNTSDTTLRTWNTTDWSTIIYNKIHFDGEYMYWRHSAPCDDVRMFRKNIRMASAPMEIMHAKQDTSLFTVGGDLTLSLYPSAVIQVIGTTFNNGNYPVVQSSYDVDTNTTEILVGVSIPADQGYGGSIIRLTNVSILQAHAYGSPTNSPNTLHVFGDVSNSIYSGTNVTISNSNQNNGGYIAKTSVYDALSNTTVISLLDSTPIISTELDGTLSYINIDFDMYDTVSLNPPDTGIYNYEALNSVVVKLKQSEFRDIVTIYTIAPSPRKLSPAKLVDKKSNIVQEQIPMWHPAFGIHYYKCIHNIDIMSANDPSNYTTSLDRYNTTGQEWNVANIGTTWYDTSKVGYVPYYDKVIFPDINNRLYKWGKLAEYGDVRVYQWVQSSTPPSSWDALAMSQQGDISIPNDQKITGKAKQTLFKRSRDIISGSIHFGPTATVSIPFGSVLPGQIIFFTSTSVLPIELQYQAKFVVSATTPGNPQTFQLLDLNYGTVVTNLLGNEFETTVINVGNANHPIQLIKAPVKSVVLGDTVTIATIVNGLYPLGATKIPVNSIEYQEIVFTTEQTNTSSTQLSNATTYTATISVNGTIVTASVLGTNVQTIGQLISYLSGILSNKATVSVVNGHLRITSLVSTDTIKITDGNLFKSIAGFWFINVIGNSTSEYLITNIDNTSNSQQTFELSTLDNVPITIMVADVGQMTIRNTTKQVNVVQTFDQSFWYAQDFARQRIIGTWLNSDAVLDPLLHWEYSPLTNVWYDRDSVVVYLNGSYIGQSIVSYNPIDSRFEVSTNGFDITINPYDYIDVVRDLHTLSAAEKEFDPDVEDDGTTTTQWKYDYQFSETVAAVNNFGTQQTYYYFWVEQSTTSPNTTDGMSISEITNKLKHIDSPYLIVQKPMDSETIPTLYGYDRSDYGAVWDMHEPTDVVADATNVMYRQAIIRNIAQYVDDSSQYMIQFTRDLALRDRLPNIYSQMNVKNKHQEWVMFREGQLDNIPIMLWNKMVESLTGISLLDSSPIPSLDRRLYDDKYGTNTRYGLATGQAFIDKNLGISTLQHYLLDPSNNFAPIDINDFFSRHDFSTSVGIKAVLAEIYGTFGSEHVNRIWFELLQDALSTKDKYKGLMKTSWVALRGVRVLEVNGMFDE